MLKVFEGSDTYESYLSAKEYVRALADKANQPIAVIDADLVTVNQFLQDVQNIGLFSTGKVILAKRLFNNSKLVEYLTDNLDTAKDYNIAIWHDGKLDKRKSLVKKLSKLKRVVSFKEQKSWEVENWLKKKLMTTLTNKRNAKRFASEMIEKIGTDKWYLTNELSKVDLYVEATAEDPDLSVILSGDAEGDIWQFLDLLTTGKSAQALQEFDKLTKYEKNDQYLIAMLVRELSLLADYLHAPSTKRTAKALGIHPYVFEKLTKKARNFTAEKIEKLVNSLLRLDLAVKQGSLDPRTGLTLYLLAW